jgi:hypothetical protein
MAGGSVCGIVVVATFQLLVGVASTGFSIYIRIMVLREIVGVYFDDLSFLNSIVLPALYISLFAFGVTVSDFALIIIAIYNIKWIACLIWQQE